jgi:hypothetical protein
MKMYWFQYVVVIVVVNGNVGCRMRGFKFQINAW